MLIYRGICKAAAAAVPGYLLVRQLLFKSSPLTTYAAPIRKFFLSTIAILFVVVVLYFMSLLFMRNLWTHAHYAWLIWPGSTTLVVHIKFIYFDSSYKKPCMSTIPQCRKVEHQSWVCAPSHTVHIYALVICPLSKYKTEIASWGRNDIIFEQR